MLLFVRPQRGTTYNSIVTVNSEHITNLKLYDCCAEIEIILFNNNYMSFTCLYRDNPGLKEVLEKMVGYDCGQAQKALDAAITW